MKMMSRANEMVDAKKLARVLEPVIRKIVREEIARAAAQKPGVFYLEPGTPLYQDMEQILRDAQSGSVKLLSREEALRD
jgi:hypothetical protein